MRIKGKITSWNEQKGFGFIAPFEGGEQIFVHITAFGDRNCSLEVGQIVTYERSSDNRGRSRAIKVTISGASSPKIKKYNFQSLPVIVAVLFLLVVGGSVLLAKIPLYIFTLYIVVSILTFITYALDKSAAKSGEWRTQESTLHLLSLAGGWPGALIAQQKLRHKSKKQSFRVVFWVTVLLNCGAFTWLCTPKGAEVLHSFVSKIL